MKRIIKNMLNVLIPFAEIFYLPLLVISGLVMWLYRRTGSKRLRLSTKTLRKIGIFPIRDHYYEPLFNDAHLSRDLKNPRELPGIDFNEEGQLEFLQNLIYQTEFSKYVEIEKCKSDVDAFKFGNGSFESGDAEFLYNIVRHIKPKRIIEVGCGTSTKIIQHALKNNEAENSFRATHVCVEPYEQPWLASYPNIKLVREKIELLDLKLFEELEAGDLLFIDSSHMVRPQGDVLHEYLTIIPSLNNGVYVHVHDIFTPRDYLENWIKENVLFWNEQYVLEALLTGNKSLEIVAALNLLKHKHYNELHKVCPYLTPDREPGSFYFRTK
jgi:predicted O-methyltransferase YrrM